MCDSIIFVMPRPKYVVHPPPSSSVNAKMCNVQVIQYLKHIIWRSTHNLCSFETNYFFSVLI